MFAVWLAAPINRSTLAVPTSRRERSSLLLPWLRAKRVFSGRDFLPRRDLAGFLLCLPPLLLDREAGLVALEAVAPSVRGCSGGSVGLPVAISAVADASGATSAG